ARQGDEVELSAAGPDAESAVERVATLFDDGFGEGTDTESSTAMLAAPRPDTRRNASTATVAPVPSGSVLRGRGVSAGVRVAP
ncbi:hypothetical protein HER21_48320, partial [Pseudomonas sp. BGM005]|nr:hypothetical protein [Pseudomonas sp. BG5]